MKAPLTFMTVFAVFVGVVSAVSLVPSAAFNAEAPAESAESAELSAGGADSGAGDEARKPVAETPRADASLLPVPENSGGPLYVIPVQGQIEGALVYVFRRGIQEAIDSKASAIVLDMDTPGGDLGSIWKIMELLQRSPVPTYTYVNPNAISGGALISLATKHIVMSPGALIGDAKPILGSPLPMGSPQEVPDGLREKIMSPALAKVRAAAQHTGRASDVGESMMDESVELVRDGHVISAKGRILTLTNVEAERMYGDPPSPLLSEGTYDTLDTLLRHLGGGTDSYTVRTMQVSSSERIARILAGPLSPFLLGLGLLLLYIEIKTPGFGLPGLSGILLMALWFWGQHVAALAGALEFTMFLLGVVLLAVEVFLIPGFGVTGIIGILLIVAGLFSAMMPRLPGPGGFALPEGVLTAAIWQFTLSVAVLTGGAWLLGGLLPKTPVFRRFALQTVVGGRAIEVETADLAAGVAEDNLRVGLRGVTLGACRPAGIARFAGRRLSVVSAGEFLRAGAEVELVARRGNNWEVRLAAPAEGVSGSGLDA